MRENTYVRIFGNIRSFQNQRSLAAFNIKAIEDMNQLTTHLLEVVHSHLWWTKSQVMVSSLSLIHTERLRLRFLKFGANVDVKCEQGSIC